MVTIKRLNGLRKSLAVLIWQLTRARSKNIGVLQAATAALCKPRAPTIASGVARVGCAHPKPPPIEGQKPPLLHLLRSLPRLTGKSTAVDFIIYRARLPSLPRLISQSTAVDFSSPPKPFPGRCRIRPRKQQSTVKIGYSAKTGGDRLLSAAKELLWQTLYSVSNSISRMLPSLTLSAPR